MTSTVFVAGFSIIAVCLLALAIFDRRRASTIRPPVDLDLPLRSVKRQSVTEIHEWTPEDRLLSLLRNRSSSPRDTAATSNAVRLMAARRVAIDRMGPFLKSPRSS